MTVVKKVESKENWKGTMLVALREMMTVEWMVEMMVAMKVEEKVSTLAMRTVELMGKTRAVSKEAMLACPWVVRKADKKAH
jgi:ATP-dependent RNA circularization protein (DNA/RNA ligase family)